MHRRESTTWNNAITGNKILSFIRNLKKYLKILGGNIKKNKENDRIFYNILI